MFKKIELLANIAIIVVALLLGVVLVRRYLLPGQPGAPAAASEIKPGTKVALDGVDWGRSQQTLLLVVSNSCHFCTESAPFYRRIAEERAKRNDLRVIAVLPQDVSAGQNYLSGLGVSVDEVRQSSLADIGVRGTPTLLLVDRTGAVKKSWLGRLPEQQEAEVLREL